MAQQKVDNSKGFRVSYKMHNELHITKCGAGFVTALTGWLKKGIVDDLTISRVTKVKQHPR